MNTVTVLETFIKQYLRNAPEFAAKLKPGSEDLIVKKLEKLYTTRDGHLVDQNNLATDIETAIKTHCRDQFNILSSGRLVPEFADRRTTEQKAAHKAELKQLLKDRIAKKGFVFLPGSDDMVNNFLESASAHGIAEDDGTGNGFNIAVTLNGVKVKSVSPDELINHYLSPYKDQSKSELSEARLEARFRKEALELAGMTLEDLRDPKKKSGYEKYMQLVKDEHFAQPYRKKLPDIPLEDLKKDLRKTGAWEKGLPVDVSLLTLNERQYVDSYADNKIQEAEQQVLSYFKEVSGWRTPEVIKQSFEKHSGFDYPAEN